MMFEDFQAVIDFAIEKEVEAAAFYDQASDEASFSGARKMLKTFASEERKHKTMLENIGSQAISDYKFETIANLKRSDFLVELEYEKGMNYRDILRVGMKREENSRNMYLELEKHAHQEVVKNLFHILAQEEGKHKLKLETLYDDFMAESGD
ncbi:MAG: ferritin family protein [Desulfobacterales bacterium]|nr:ferritin family protein [Desulfobacterales bacterium]MDD4071348.1 ferritin family protein [Desulfobacterales bacterium]MDD4392680.1 ferritin family protein [Desulfobacterales bacterium]